ncbi:TPM domain-containing protein [Winogradskyella sp. 3972H.M.0a.05]|uniref:TPM domain-containing protein n=1 Tax=Winogradskyella sp. 3972H.M.0a.05 TaxID=2950277 RepID=UPI003390FD51
MSQRSIEDFLTASQEQQIIDTIRNAERQTSGEIRVHLEHNTHDKTIEERTLEVFQILKMHNTEQHNAVLIYVAVEDKQFAIYGDKGINEVVSDDFWDSTKSLMTSHFKKDDYANGLIAAIQEAGKQLKAFFPWRFGDRDELSNEISKG